MAKTPRRPAADAPRPVYMGPRIRRLRRELGLTQQAMAEDLSISPSYIALIERNQRPVTADILLRIARGYRLDLAELAVDESADHARRIADVLRDPIFAGIDLPALEVADLAASFPGLTEALLRLYAAYTREQAVLAEMAGGEAGAGAAPDRCSPIRPGNRYLHRTRRASVHPIRPCPNRPEKGQDMANNAAATTGPLTAIAHRRTNQDRWRTACK